MRRFIKVAIMAACISVSTQGCAALVVGYLVGDAISKSKATDTCRANMQTTNQARIAKGQEPFPDQCGR